MRKFLLRLAPLVLLSACQSHANLPDLGLLYDTAAMAHGVERNPVIVIPGLLGSTLKQSGTERTVWGAFVGNYANPNKPDGARLVALPMEPGVPLIELADDVYASGALESLELRFFGLPIGVAAYVNILRVLGVGGYLDKDLAVDYGDEHFTCFQFAYDWRRDIPENAARLHEYMLEQKAYVEEEYRVRYGVEKEVRFDVVAHSMGGLLVRYLLRYGDQGLPEDGGSPRLDWSGAELIQRAVLVAPPNAGSAQAFWEMLHGNKIGAFLPRYSAALLGTMPAAYQLLPRPRHAAYRKLNGEPIANALEPELWARMQWGLADPDQDSVLRNLLPDVETREERLAIALDHQSKCLERAEQLFRALDVPAKPPEGTELILVAGDSHETRYAMKVDLANGDVRVAGGGPGDGTVLRSSALMDERVGSDWQPVLKSPISWDRVFFFFDSHLGLTMNPGFMDNLLYLLLEEPR